MPPKPAPFRAGFGLGLQAGSLKRKIWLQNVANSWVNGRNPMGKQLKHLRNMLHSCTSSPVASRSKVRLVDRGVAHSFCSYDIAASLETTSNRRCNMMKLACPNIRHHWKYSCQYNTDILRQVEALKQLGTTTLWQSTIAMDNCPFINALPWCNYKNWWLFHSYPLVN